MKNFKNLSNPFKHTICANAITAAIAAAVLSGCSGMYSNYEILESAKYYERNGDYSAAVGDYLTLAERGEKGGNIKQVASSYAKAAKYASGKKAQEYAQKAERAYLTLAQEAERREDFKNAAEYYEKTDDKAGYKRCNLAQYENEFSRGRYEEAAIIANSKLGNQELVTKAYAALCASYMKKTLYERASECAKKHLNDYALANKALKAAAQAEFASQNYDRAARLYERIGDSAGYFKALQHAATAALAQESAYAAAYCQLLPGGVLSTISKQNIAEAKAPSKISQGDLENITKKAKGQAQKCLLGTADKAAAMAKKRTDEANRETKYKTPTAYSARELRKIAAMAYAAAGRFASASEQLHALFDAGSIEAAKEKNAASWPGFFMYVLDSSIAAGTGTRDDYFRRGWLLAERSSYQSARADYERACSAGSLVACNNLGVIFSDGKGMKMMDKTRAAGLFRKACAAGKGAAVGCYNLGKFAELGHGGLMRNFAQAKQFYKLACNADYYQACSAYNSLEQGVSTVDKSSAEVLTGR